MKNIKEIILVFFIGILLLLVGLFAFILKGISDILSDLGIFLNAIGYTGLCIKAALFTGVFVVTIICSLLLLIRKKITIRHVVSIVFIPFFILVLYVPIPSKNVLEEPITQKVYAQFHARKNKYYLTIYDNKGNKIETFPISRFESFYTNEGVSVFKGNGLQLFQKANYLEQYYVKLEITYFPKTDTRLLVQNIELLSQVTPFE